MKKWTLRVLYALLVLLPVAAIADYTATQGSGTTVFTFTCFSTKLCPAHTIINSAGTEVGTSGSPIFFDSSPSGNLNTLLTSATPAGTNTIGNVNGAPNVTPTDCSGTIATGGTAQNAFTAGATKHGFTVVNIDTTEPLWISFTTTAAASGSGSYPLQAATASTFAGAGSFTTPTGFGISTALSVIAATTSHKFTCTWW